MTEVSRKITVDLSRKGGARPIFAVQNDRGKRNLCVRLTDDGAPYKIEDGTTAAFNYKRPDGVCGALTATVRDGELSVYLNPIAIGVVGNTVCTVSLFDASGNKLTSSELCLEVAEELYSGEALNDSPEYTLLESLFARLSGYETAEEERILRENERERAEEERARAEAVRDKKINENLGSGGEIILKEKLWDAEKSQKITVLGLGETDLIVFYPSSESDRGILANYGVFISPDAVGETVTARAGMKPISDISLRYFIVRGRKEGEV